METDGVVALFQRFSGKVFKLVYKTFIGNDDYKSYVVWCRDVWSVECR